MLWRVSVLACLLATLGGCKHQSPHERMQKLLYQSDESGPPDASKARPGPSPVPPERIHGGII